ncbi:hypothetical protein Q7W32_07625 [Streptococcus suis]|nr:hypothetical protein [Streptococcus suis]
MESNKLVLFAQAVGADVKELKTALNGKVSSETLAQAIEQVKTAVKTELLGDGVPEQMDTLKEIADAIAGMNGETEQAVVQKIAQLGSRLDAVESLDLVTAYTSAKNG